MVIIKPMTNDQKIIAGGWKNLQVVTDFDRTLTKAIVAGKVASLMSTMIRENIFDADYVAKAKNSYAYYRPIEIDETLPFDYRCQKMQEWWELAFKVLIEKKLSKAKINLAFKKSHLLLRNGVREFLITLAEKKVPVIILSANGLGDESIRQFLEVNQLNFSNIQIFSNQYVWDESGVAVDYKKPLIHVLNKDYQIVKDSPVYEKLDLASRQNVIAIGDGISDLKMIDHCDYKNLLKIGFLNEEIATLRPAFKKAFDEVIENDGNFDYLNQLLNQIKD